MIRSFPDAPAFALKGVFKVLQSQCPLRRHRRTGIGIVRSIIVAALATSPLAACGSIEFSEIYGLPNSTDGGTPILQDLEVGERPYFSAKFDEGSLDNIQGVSLRYRVGLGPMVFVGQSQADCSQVSGRELYCTYSLGGTAPAGAVVTSIWSAQFRLAGTDRSTRTTELPGTLVPQELDWHIIGLFSRQGTEFTAVPITNGAFTLAPAQSYFVITTFKNNGGSVVPLVADTRIEFENPTIPSQVVTYVNNAGLEAGATGSANFNFTTPDTTAESSGTITISFVGNDDDEDPSNDTGTLLVRIES